MPQVKIEPVTLKPDRYRHVVKTRATVFVLTYLCFFPFGHLVGRLLGYAGDKRWLMMPVLALPMVSALFAAIVAAQWMASEAFQAFLNPGGSRAPAAISSRVESLVARGRYEEAAAEFAALRATYPHDIPLLRVEAEFHAGVGNNPQRAVQTLNQLRRVAGVPGSVERYATHRLLDLYLGVLADPGRAMVELRRMADRFPDTPDGQGALAELRRRRDHLAQDQTQT
ncbi:hypothetical protein [Gemmatimonas sp.]|uniref:hypothetical protein n=1 Tax=Gemmatimonas sp. TaxID=1962908 RepID=UPI0039837432